jgi:drug/metabolite transporter (DMT)-like permease
MNRSQFSSILQALMAALLFGASAPLAKYLLGEIEPVPLAAFLYLGSGLSLLGLKAFQRMTRRQPDLEANIQPKDWFWLAGAVVAGGIAAPILLLFSLRQTPAATAALLLCFEGVATTLIAFVVFKEAISPRAWWAILLVTLASIALAVNGNGDWGFSLGALGILAACIFWGIDNNFTRNISAKDPLAIVTIKGLGAGTFSLGMALALGSPLPGLAVILGAMVLGSFSYGASIVLFIRAMRGLGAARTSALFGTAPLSGILFSLLIFREMPSWLFLVALPLSLMGTLLLVNETHEHRHTHEKVIHDHAHNHADTHHTHRHANGSAQMHSHLHPHAEEPHAHQHLPDIHHRHTHPSKNNDSRLPPKDPNQMGSGS